MLVGQPVESVAPLTRRMGLALAGNPFTKAGVYAASSVHGFSNLWPQKVGFPP